MCEPLTATTTLASGATVTSLTTTGMIVAGAASTAASSMLQLVGQQQAARQQTQYQNTLQIQRQQQMALNEHLADAAAADQQAQINTDLVKKDAASKEELFNNQVAANEARAAATVSAGEAGAAGVSVDALLADFSRKEGRFADSVGTNIEGFRQNADLAKKQAEDERVGRIQSVQPYLPSPVEGPNYFGAIAAVGQSAASYWLQDQNNQQLAKLKTQKLP